MASTISWAGCGGGSETGGAADDAEATPTDAADPADETLAGVPLGAFRIREQRPTENQRIDLKFALHAAVKMEDEERLEKLIAAKQNALRDQIIVAVRTAATIEFDEPKLAMLKRRMLLRIAGVLNEQIVQDLFFTDYQCQFD